MASQVGLASQPLNPSPNRTSINACRFCPRLPSHTRIAGIRQKGLGVFKILVLRNPMGGKHLVRRSLVYTASLMGHTAMHAPFSINSRPSIVEPLKDLLQGVAMGVATNETQRDKARHFQTNKLNQFSSLGAIPMQSVSLPRLKSRVRPPSPALLISGT